MRRGSIGSDVPSPGPPRTRRMTYGSEDMGEKAAKMNIDMNSSRKGSLKQERFARTSLSFSSGVDRAQSLSLPYSLCRYALGLSVCLSLLAAEFRFNAEMSLRVACGVLLASGIQTRDPDYEPNSERSKKWFLFPDWYYLGGLSYCAVAVIFSAQKNVGATIREVCQAFYGVGMALIYNMVIFSVVTIRTSDPTAADPTAGFYQITKTFSSTAYWINSHNFYTVLPFIMLFTVVVLLLPIENNTKKFAVGNNLYFGTYQ